MCSSCKHYGHSTYTVPINLILSLDLGKHNDNSDSNDEVKLNRKYKNISNTHKKGKDKDS